MTMYAAEVLEAYYKWWNNGQYAYELATAREITGHAMENVGL